MTAFALTLRKTYCYAPAITKHSGSVTHFGF